MNEINLMFSAIKSQFPWGNTSFSPENTDSKTIENIYTLSLKQDMAHIVSAQFEKIAEGETKANFKKQKMLAVFRREQLNFEEARVSELLEENGIDYIPLKGSVIKKYYPAEWMRTSSDIDILVKTESAEEAKRLICEKLGYKYEGESLKDIQLYSESKVHLELHFAVTCNDEKLDKVLSRIWDYAKPIPEKCRYELTPEFLIFHTIAHAQYHFAAGGCGIKPFLDIWVLENNIDYDKGIFEVLIKESQSEKFFNAFLKLMRVWFEGENGDALTENMEKFIFDGGVYGTRENLGSAQVHRGGGKAKYLFRRIFKPKRSLEAQYPKLKKYPILLPYYQVKRWFNLFDDERRTNVKQEFIGSMESGNIGDMLKELGL